MVVMDAVVIGWQRPGWKGGSDACCRKNLVPAELQTNGLILERAGRTKVTNRRLIGNLERRTDWDVNGR